MDMTLPQRLRDAAESLHLPPSIQSQRNIRVMDACDQAAEQIERYEAALRNMRIDPAIYAAPKATR